MSDDPNSSGDSRTCGQCSFWLSSQSDDPNEGICTKRIGGDSFQVAQALACEMFELIGDEVEVNFEEAIQKLRALHKLGSTSRSYVLDSPTKSR